MTRYTSDVTVLSGEVVRPVWRFGVFPEGQGNMAFQMIRPEGGADPVFRNYGSVEYVSDDPNAEVILLWVDYSSSFWSATTWENHGDLIARAPNGEARGYWAFSWGPDLLNAGRLVVEGHRYALAFQSWDGVDPQIRNSGEIVARSDGETNAIIFGNSARVENSGYVAAFSSTSDHSFEATAVQLLRGGTVINTGEIRAESTLPNMRPRGVELLPGGDGAQVTNTGLIVAKDAVYENPYGAGVTYLTNGAGGRIIGNVSLGDYSDRLANNGWIDGRVDLGAGDDNYTSVSGAVTGGVLAGDGNDTVEGGGGFDRLRGDAGDDRLDGGGAFDDLNGNVGRDTVRGGSGDDWVLGGKDADLLYGDDGADILNGNLGADTCDGGPGDDSVRGGQGDDMLAGGVGNDWITGDLGDDTLTGDAGADIFRAFNGGGMDRITEFNAAAGDRVAVDGGSTYSLKQSGADTVITFADGSATVLSGVTLSSLPAGWIFGG
ncbi:calcium-binding protein [Phenylobacterium sp. LjRoot225]|uniref:calcium-binding protein n=1 Tax=Phenylobacterium sp. LjRoot225 TaxID=3342285 RepID=UPI003ECCA5DA